MARQDEFTTVSELRDMLTKFRLERDWTDYHTPKNLSQAISIEASELMELFLWKTDEEIDYKLKELDFRKTVSYELVDIIAYCLNFANAANIDVSQALEEKMILNQRKYPVDKALGAAAEHQRAE